MIGLKPLNLMVFIPIKFLKLPILLYQAISGMFYQKDKKKNKKLNKLYFTIQLI